MSSGRCPGRPTTPAPGTGSAAGSTGWRRGSTPSDKGSGRATDERSAGTTTARTEHDDRPARPGRRDAWTPRRPRTTRRGGRARPARRGTRRPRRPPTAHDETLIGATSDASDYTSRTSGRRPRKSSDTLGQRTGPVAAPAERARWSPAAAALALVAGGAGGAVGYVLADHNGDSVTIDGANLGAAPARNVQRPDGSVADVAAHVLPSVVQIKVNTSRGAGHRVRLRHRRGGAAGHQQPRRLRRGRARASGRSSTVRRRRRRWSARRPAMTWPSSRSAPRT